MNKPTASDKPAAPPPPSNKLGILYVEDEGDQREVMRELLRHERIELTVAENGAEAIRHMQRTKFHIIITDVRMPQITGDDMIKRLRDQYSASKLNKDVPVIVLSGFLDTAMSVKLAMHANVHQLEKPIAINVLLDMIQAILKLSEPL